jgi:hypothetical protein
VKQTLRSAADFALGSPSAKLGGAALPGKPPAAEPPEASSVGPAPAIGVGSPGSLGALQLGAAQLTSREPPPNALSNPRSGLSGDNGGGESPGSVPAPQVVVTPPNLGETTRMDVGDPALLGVPRAPGVSGTAQTVPMISPALVASVIARGPGVQPAPAPPPPSGVLQSAVPLREAAPGGTFPMIAPVVPIVPTAPAPLPPPTPPVYPLAPPDAGRTGISGVRGLLIGFVAGAVIMALVAVIYVLVLRH